MPAYALSHVSNERLLADLVALVATDRQTTAALLAHLAEVEARELFLPEACTSLYAYCTRMLGLSDDAALKRIRAARVARRFPPIFDMIADGRLHLSGVVILGPHLSVDNADELLAAAAHRSKAEIEVLVVRFAPRPDLPTSITPIDPPGAGGSQQPLVPGPPPELAPPARARVKPLSPERYGLQVTITQETRDKLERAKALLLHRNPSGDVADVIDRALDALLAKLEKEKFAATSRPRAAKKRAADADPRSVPNDVKRAVRARDGEQCSFVSASGVRCTERGFLERDHRTPVALGGQPTVDEIRHLCHAHDQYEAKRRLGADFMRAKRQQAMAERAAAAAAAAPPRVVEPAVAAVVTRPFDADVTEALCTMGFKPSEAQRAMARSATRPATTFEERIRAALAELCSRPSRCSDGPFELATTYVDGWST
jgi:hypothetical protein